MSNDVAKLWGAAEKDPMPDGLALLLSQRIEPYTWEKEVEHSIVMDALNLAYPIIKDWLFTQTTNWTPQIGSRDVES